MRNSRTVSQRDIKSDRLASAISLVLTRECIPAERKGYHYLAYAIEEAYMDREMAGAVSKGLYPAVAKAFSTSPEAVERAIRTAVARGSEIKKAAKEESGEEITGRKTNSEFIFQAAEQVKMLLDNRTFRIR